MAEEPDINRRHSRRMISTADKKNKNSKRGPNMTTIYCDFSRLEMSSLKRYIAFFQIQVPHDASKEDLVQAVSKHFATKPKIREAEVISQFLYNTRSWKKRK